MNQLLNIILDGLVVISLASRINPSATNRVVPLGEEFSLALGEKIEIKSENLTLHFQSVPEDYRCPTQVDCESEGQAIVVIEAV